MSRVFEWTLFVCKAFNRKFMFAEWEVYCEGHRTASYGV